MKIGPIGEEMLATRSAGRGTAATVHALHVIRVPLDAALDAELLDEEERASASLIDAKLLAAEHGVRSTGIVRARAIGEAIVDEATRDGADLIVIGLGAPLAPAVALLQPDRRLRPAHERRAR